MRKSTSPTCNIPFVLFILLVSFCSISSEGKDETVVLSMPDQGLGFSPQLAITASGEFYSFLLEDLPGGPEAGQHLVLRARKGQLQLTQQSFSVAAAPNSPGVITLLNTIFDIDTSGRLARVRLLFEVRATPQSNPIQSEILIDVLMEMAYTLYEPATLAIESGEVAQAGGKAAARFNLRIDATGSENTINWLFFRSELYTSRGTPASPALFHQQLLDSPHARNTVRYAQALTQEFSPENIVDNQPMRLTGVLVGQDSAGRLIVQQVRGELAVKL
jgi:hypothetical protein